MQYIKNYYKYAGKEEWSGDASTGRDGAGESKPGAIHASETAGTNEKTEQATSDICTGL